MFKDLQRLTPHVWVHPPSPDPAEVQSAVGVVVGEDETLLIDAGNSPKLARHIQEQLEMYLAARPQLELMMNQVSGKSLAEDEAKAEEPGDEKEQAEAAKNKVLEERGAVLKAELRERLELSFQPDFLRARHVRQHGWPGQEKPLEPIKGVSAGIARTVCGSWRRIKSC